MPPSDTWRDRPDASDRAAGEDEAGRPGRDVMPLMQHLTDLRRCLLRALVALAVGTVASFAVFHPLFHLLTAPYCSLPVSRRLGGHGCTLVVFGVPDAFMLRLRISMFAGAVFSSPVWLYQLWAFIAPGLHRRERRWALSFVGASVLLFSAGAATAYATLSNGLAVLLGFAGSDITPVLEVTRYLSYITAMIMVFGFSFEFPLLLILLNLAGVLSSTRLRHSRRLVIFLLFAFAAVATPSQDPFTMLALAAPLCLLYEIAISMARLVDRRRARHAASELSDDLASDLQTLLAAEPGHAEITG